MHAKSPEHGTEKVRSSVEVIEDDRQRAGKIAFDWGMTAQTANPKGCLPFSTDVYAQLAPAIALALAETRERAGIPLQGVLQEMHRQADIRAQGIRDRDRRIDELEVENKLLVALLKSERDKAYEELSK